MSRANVLTVDKALKDMKLTPYSLRRLDMIWHLVGCVVL